MKPPKGIKGPQTGARDEVAFDNHDDALRAKAKMKSTNYKNNPILGGMQRSTKPAQVKKVAPPTVPDVANRKSGGSYSSGYSSSNTVDRNSYGSMAGTDDSFPPTPSPPVPTNKDNCNIGPVYPSNNNNSTTIGDGSPAHTFPPYALSGQQYPYSHLTIGRGSTTSQPGSPLIQDPSFTQPHLYERYAPVYQQQASLEDQGIDMQSPGRDSPGSSGSSGSGCGSSSTGCRNSTTSLDSGRASSSAYDGKTGLNYVASTQHRLSGQSYESSGSLRHSYHSSSSSLGSMEEAAHTSQINVAELFAAGYPDHDVLNLWLVDLHFEEYYHLFVQAGYDMPTISRMTPEDLTAIGITKPGHRKKLKAEIARLNISDGLPVYIPSTLEEWLHLLHLEEYEDALRQQGYHTVEQVTDVAWEDLEEIGIKKLGHQKKVMLAIKRVKDIMGGVRRFSTDQRESTHMMSGEAMHMYNYSPQDVAITPSSRSMASPSAALDSIAQPEMRTFQQSPVMQRSAEMYRYDGVPPGSPLHHLHHHPMYHHHPHHPFPHPAVSGHHTYRPNYASVIGTGSPSHLLYRPDMVAVHVRHPSGARSLENLESERETMKPHYGVNSSSSSSSSSSSAEPRLYDGMMTWRRGSYDDGDLTPTNEAMVAYEVEGGGTLPRPKVSVKPRPVAKIIAKTRRASTDSATDLIYIEREAECKPMAGGDLCTNTTTTIADVVTHGSPRHQLVGSSNTLGRTKKTPPAPPKRTNSIKNERNAVDKNINSKSEQAFANCVKSLASKFSMPSHDDDLPPPPKDELCGNRVISCLVDEFPPPPSPVRASLDDLTTATPTPDAGEQDSARLNSSPQQMDSDTELPHHPKRNDSNSSFDSSSSTDSNSLPFANENVGTIKQKAAQPHTSITVVELAWSPRSSPVAGKKLPPSGATPPPIPPRQNVKMEHAQQTQAKNGNPIEDPMAVRRPQDTGDVLNDIGNMLADLTDELDAMLVTELQGQ
uniref:SAM domain-containing protein n=1 Tax=Strigamia maritima TaxID=126957 RepID=T1J6Y4_STRMM